MGEIAGRINRDVLEYEVETYLSELAVRAHRMELKDAIPAGVTPGIAGTILTSEASRKTEKTALARCNRLPRLAKWQKHLIKLDQIASNPLLHLEMRVKNRPARTIHQPMARAAWIASQPGVGMTTMKVFEALNRSSTIIAASIRAGYEPSILD